MIDGSITDPSHKPKPSTKQFAEKQKVQYPIYLTADLFATLRYPRYSVWVNKRTAQKYIYMCVKVAQEQDIKIVRIHTLNRNIMQK